MKRLRTLKSFKIFKSEIQKLKTYSGVCAFKGLFNDTTLMQIQSGRTVPLINGILIVESMSSKFGGEVFISYLSQPYPVEVCNEDNSIAGQVCYFSYVSFKKNCAHVFSWRRLALVSCNTSFPKLYV
jgi:hypothetical protein